MTDETVPTNGTDGGGWYRGDIRGWADRTGLAQRGYGAGVTAGRANRAD